eukprot:jgi/Mesen1/216/ME1140549C07668
MEMNSLGRSNVASFSDGPEGAPAGTPFFYLTALDPTAADVARNPLCSLTLSVAVLQTCGAKDPENPSCAKLTLSGQEPLQAMPVDEQSRAFSTTSQMELVVGEAEVGKARAALFSKHAEMQHWPEGHHFRFYKLVIADIFLVDWFGVAKPVSVDEYFAAEVAPLP